MTMSVLAAQPSVKETFLANFDLNACSDSDPRLDAVRNEAREALHHLEFPTRRDEYWKYTPVTPILKGNYHTIPGSGEVDLSPSLIDGLDTYNLVFVNGYFQPENSSLPEGIMVAAMSEAKANWPDAVAEYYGQLADHKNHAFTALNTACCSEGAFIRVKANQVIDKPIRLINLTEGDNIAYHPRNLMVFERNSHAQVILSYETGSGQNAFTNAVTEIKVDQNAKADLYLLQHKSDTNSHVETTQVLQERDSRFSIATITLKGRIVRNNLNIIVDGENCETNLYGIYLTKGKQHVDNHTLVDHRKPHCESNELYKGIMNEQSTGVFNGKVFVRQLAQKTNAYQSNQNILLTDGATINSKPELEIYADDVKCSHGSTTGQFDEEAVFYLRSRGLSESSARRLLVYAFANDVLDRIDIEPLRDRIENYIAERYENVL